ncbi:MAG: hypothetical protein C0602_05375 [Denitrovibrio sp.]|nr:MAG: hypothetical protein C0602_05375 [Denitrovibrio sp.]
MKLFSTEITTAYGEKIAKAVLLKKTRSGYSLLDHYTTEPENLKSVSENLITYFCIDYFDTIIESLNVPPVKDPSTFKLLAKNKLKEHMEEGVDYLMAYKIDKTAPPDKSGNVHHKVYVIPEHLFRDHSGLTEKQKLKVNMFTLSDFALMAASKSFFHDDVVFHAYADEYKVLITVSKEDTIIYSRTMEYTDDGSAIENIFYESINLTYMFVTKNMRVDVDRMVLSGLLIDMTELSKMLFDFNQKPQNVIMHSKIINDCTRETFHRYMIPISLCMLSNSYDFTPESIKEQRGFNILKKTANALGLIFIFFLIYINISAFEEMGFAKEKLRSQTNVIGLKLDRHIQNFTDTQMSRYGLYYLKQIDKNFNGAFDLYKDVAGILETGDYENVRFSSEGKKSTVLINGSVSFSSFKEIDIHRQAIDSQLEELQANGKYTVTNTSRYDMDRLNSDVKIKLEKVK